MLKFAVAATFAVSAANAWGHNRYGAQNGYGSGYGSGFGGQRGQGRELEVEAEFEYNGDFESNRELENRGDFDYNREIELRGDFEHRGEFEFGGDFERKNELETRGDFEYDRELEAEGNFSHGHGNIGGYGGSYGGKGGNNDKFAGYGATFGYDHTFGKNDKYSFDNDNKNGKLDAFSNDFDRYEKPDYRSYDNDNKIGFADKANGRDFGNIYGKQDYQSFDADLTRGKEGKGDISRGYGGGYGAHDNSYDLGGYGGRDNDYGRDNSYSFGNTFGDFGRLHDSQGSYGSGYDEKAFDAGFDGFGGFGIDKFKGNFGSNFDSKAAFGGFGKDRSYGKQRRSRDNTYRGFDAPKEYGNDYTDFSSDIDWKMFSFGNDIGKRSLGFGPGIDSKMSGYEQEISWKASSYKAPRSPSYNKYGPFGYNEPMIQYEAYAPKGSFKAIGPKEDLNIYSAKFEHRTFSGATTFKGPKISNQASMARMEVYSPTIDVKMPQVGIKGGNAYTVSPENRKQHAVTGANMYGPKIDLWAPHATTKMRSPQGHFSTQAPQNFSKIQTTRDFKRHEAPVHYIRPSIW